MYTFCLMVHTEHELAHSHHSVHTCVRFNTYTHSRTRANPKHNMHDVCSTAHTLAHYGQLQHIYLFYFCFAMFFFRWLFSVLASKWKTIFDFGFGSISLKRCAGSITKKNGKQNSSCTKMHVSNWVLIWPISLNESVCRSGVTPIFSTQKFLPFAISFLLFITHQIVSFRYSHELCAWMLK